MERLASKIPQPLFNYFAPLCGVWRETKRAAAPIEY